MHYALLGTAGAEDHSREANPGNFSRHTSRVYHWPHALVHLRAPADQLASHTRQRGNARVVAGHPDSKSALPLIAAEKKRGRPPSPLRKWVEARVGFEPTDGGFADLSLR